MIPVKDNLSLNEAILFLENKQKSEAYLLKEHFEFTKEQLNPVNIIKENFTSAISSPNIKGKLIKGAVSLVSGFLAKKFVVGSNGGMFRKLAGMALQTGVSGLILKAPENLEGSQFENVLHKFDGVKEKLEDAKDNGITMLQKGLNKLKIK